MKRSELEVGRLYATEHGLCVEVVDLTPGWAITPEGDPVRDEGRAVRVMPGAGERQYQSNVNILVSWHRQSDGARVPLAIQPRALRSAWEAHVSEHVVEEEEHQRIESMLDRLTARWKQRLTDAGVEGEFDVHLDGETIGVPAAALDSLLLKVGV